MEPATVIAPGARVLPSGTRLGKYVLQRKIARGGMAEVYLARATGADGFEKLVALKLVLPHLSEDERFIRMFRAEAKIAAQLDHPNIVQVTDLGTANGEYFIAMEYIHGKTVRSMLKEVARAGGIRLDAALAILDGACAGLHYAHECRDAAGSWLGIVHRDISPSNLMVRYDGSVKVVDFGIAKAASVTKATRTGTLKGKGGYMSPEQCRGQSLDRRSDVFGLGILLYEATTGRRLFVGDNEFAVMNRIVDGEFDLPSAASPEYPPELEAIVLRALQTDPDARYATAMELRLALESFAHAAQIRVSNVALGDYMHGLFGDPPPPAVAVEAAVVRGGTDVAPAPRRSRTQLWVGLAAVGVATVGGAAYVLAAPQPRTPRDAAAPKTPDAGAASLRLPEHDPTPPAPAAESPSIEPQLPEPASPSTSAPPPEATNTASEERAAPRGRKSKRRRGARKPAAPAKKDSDPDSFFPRSMK